ncbi:MAG: recombination protein RecR, partial [Ruminococcus sp.]|nr:recombination protein RecR [Ruminococcus sp.]
MSEANALPLVVLSEQFARLPGIGMKSAQRLAYHVMSMSDDDARAFMDAFSAARKTVHSCRIF